MSETKKPNRPDPIHDQIELSFTYHSPREEQVTKYTLLRSQAKQTAVMIADLCPPSRERSLAITKLEECVMHANAAIARHT